MVLEAFRRGADGVMWSGCHIGDCHYVFGNHRAIEQYEVTEKLVAALGLEPERLRLEWISAAEGPRFASLMTEMVEDVRKAGPSPVSVEPEPREGADESEERSKLKARLEEVFGLSDGMLCLECGKCTTACPISLKTRDTSPRRSILRIQESLWEGKTEGAFDEEIVRTCLSCGECESQCPAGIGYSRLVRSLRTLIDPADIFESCSHGGALAEIARIQSRSSAKQKRLDWLTDDLRVSETGETLLFVGCLPYQSILFEKTSPDLIEAARSAVRLLNDAGIVPAVTDQEVCCGHDLLFSGEDTTFLDLARRNVEVLEATGAKRIVTICPECAFTLKDLYAEAGINLKAEVVALPALLDQMGDRLTIGRDGGPVKATYHDGCRLGRFIDVIDEPRRLMERVPGAQLEEMPRSKRLSPCCGTVAWRNCGPVARMLQQERIQEAARTGADVLVTGCHKCKIHFDCLLKHSGADQGGESVVQKKVKIVDLASFLAGPGKGGAPCPQKTESASASSSASVD
jgi:Fe-S oxidoreductase